MKKWSIWHWLLFFALIGMTIFFGTGLVKAIASEGIGSDAAAAWTQAIGSVVAIYAAFAVSHRQHQQERFMEEERQRQSDVRKLKAVKVVLVQICSITTGLDKGTKENDATKLLDFDPQFLVDCKSVLQSLPLFDIPSVDLALFVNLIPRAIDHLTGRLISARGLECDAVESYEWLLANDFEDRLKTLHNLASDANDRCFNEIKALNGWNPEEIALNKAY